MEFFILQILQDLSGGDYKDAMKKGLKIAMSNNVYLNYQVTMLKEKNRIIKKFLKMLLATDQAAALEKELKNVKKQMDKTWWE